jgi:hypothetical protein
MQAEVRLTIGVKEARLLVRHGDDVVEDEVWTFPRPFGRSEARELAATVFADAYDMMQFVVHGDE